MRNISVPEPSRRQRFKAAAALGCLILAGLISLGESLARKGLYDQQMAQRWSTKKDAVQITAFFAQGEVSDALFFSAAEQELDQALLAASVTGGKEGARLWASALSLPGKVTLANGGMQVEVAAFGVSGDFFSFHPRELLAGSFISASDTLKDGIVIDEETAWQLFGGNDVAGMQMLLGDVPHYVSGVIRHETGRLSEAAGLDKPVCYLSAESLQAYGTVSGGYCYELVLPNPVEGFGLSVAAGILGAGTKEAVLTENTGRYEALPLLRIALSFGTRSMSKLSIAYPYWENVARGWEDILALTLLVKLLLLCPPAALLFLTIAGLWRRRAWTAEEACRRLKDYLFAERKGGKRRKQNKKKGNKKKGGISNEGKEEALGPASGLVAGADGLRRRD